MGGKLAFVLLMIDDAKLLMVKMLRTPLNPLLTSQKNVYKYTFSKKMEGESNENFILSYFNSISLIASLCLNFLDVATLAFQNERKLVRLPLKFLKSPFL